MKNSNPKFPKSGIDYVYFTIDPNEDGSISIELEGNPSSFEGLSESVKSKLTYVKQYITYLVIGEFIEVGKYRTMGSLVVSNKSMTLEYSVCRRVSKDPNKDDVWEENIVKQFKRTNHDN